MCWPDGRLQFMLNERMMPSQFVVNGDGKRFINEAAPYMDFAHAMIDGPALRRHPHPVLARSPTSGRSTATSSAGTCRSRRFRSRRCPPDARCRRRGWTPASSRRATASRNWPSKIGVPPAQLRATAERFNELARKGHDDDFNRGDSAYDNYYGDPTLPNPNLHPLGKPPYYAFQIILGDLGTSGGLRTDEHARVLRADDSVVDGPLRGRQHLGRGDGPQLRGRRRHHRTGHDVRLRRRQAHRRPTRPVNRRNQLARIDSHRR